MSSKDVNETRTYLLEKGPAIMVTSDEAGTWYHAYVVNTFCNLIYSPKIMGWNTVGGKM